MTKSGRGNGREDRGEREGEGVEKKGRKRGMRMVLNEPYSL